MTPLEEDAHGLRQLVDTLRTELTQEWHRSKSRELARAAVNQLDVDPERALLLALEANTAVVTYESRDALQQAVAASRARWVFGKAGEARILHAHFANDGRHIITAGQDGALCWWDLDAQNEVASLSCCNGPIVRLLLSPLRDRALVLASQTQPGQYQFTIVDLPARKVTSSTAEEIVTDYDEAALIVLFSQDGRRLVINNQEGTEFSLWDTASGARLNKSADVGRCHGLDQDGRRALLTRFDCSVAILDLNDGRTTVLSLPEDKVTVSSFMDLNAGPMPFSADGTRVTVGTSDRVACVWDARDGRLVHTLGDEPVGCHQSAASFTPSGRYVLVQQNDSGTTEVWDAETGKRLCELPQSTAFHVPMRFLPVPPQPGVAEYAVVGMGASHNAWPLPANQVSEWSITTGTVRSSFRLPGRPSFERCFTTDGVAVHCEVRAQQDDISPDANRVLRLEDGVVRVFARVEAPESCEIASEYGCGYTADRTIGYGVNGKTLVDARTNQVLAPLGTQDRFWFSSNGQHLVGTSHTDTNPEVHIWDARTGQLRFTIKDYTRRITALQFQPGQTQLLVGSLDGTIRLWSLETGVEVARATVDARDGPSYEAVSSSDVTKVAFATSGRIHVWHIDRGEIVHAPTGLYARDPRFSAEGAWLLALDQDVARIWETTTMQVIGEFPLHFASVIAGDLSLDKRFAATYGLDNFVRLWEPLSGREITRWEMPESHQYRRPLRFSEDGTAVFYAGQRLMVDVQQLIALAKRRVFRELSPAERQLFLEERET